MTSPRRPVSTLVLAAGLALAACGGTTLVAAEGGAAEGGADGGDADGGDAAATVHCTPGSYVFCRCARSEGTKACRADGRSFDPCSCP